MIEDRPDEHVGHVVRRLRIEKGMTQEQLADKAGVKRSWLSRVELGHRFRPEREMLEDVASALGEPASVLLRPAHHRAVPPPPRTRKTPDEIAAELVAAIRSAPVLVPELGNGDGDHWPYNPRLEERGHEFAAVRVGDRSMEPALYQGHVAVVDLSAVPRPGQIVAAEADGGVVLRFLEEQDGKLWLTGYRGWTPLPVDDEHARLLGVVVSAQYRPFAQRAGG